SPYSIISAFGMAYAGSAGDTAGEIESVLGFDSGIHDSIHELINSLDDAKLITSANRVWLRNGLTLKDAYKNTLALNYGSTLKELDMKNKTEESRKTINDWVSRKTNNKIQNLLAQLDPETQMIITNAVYFNAEWEHKFAKDNTTAKPFHVNDDKIIDVQMMIQNRDFDYAEFDGVKIIRLPYKHHRLSMIAVLPPKDNPDVIASLNAETFMHWLESLREYQVDLWLPKFKTEKKYQLADLFKSMGVNLAFSNNADFSGITDDEKLKIDAVIHQSFIDVDEEKTEAAAATAITMLRATAMMPKPKPKAEFHADRPFTYFIYDNRTGTILFMGRQTF
ncbi:MAG: serpin family protein, partial [Synergistaceae bacterium]|nr:serpin family protein [Synergistaceae bacterium]